MGRAHEVRKKAMAATAAAKTKVYSKFGKEIYIAAKAGVPDPDMNVALKRITYNPLADHDYSQEGPTMREITPGHFIYCNSEEFERYKKDLNK